MALVQPFSASAADNPDDAKNAKKGAAAVAKGPPPQVHASKPVVHTPTVVQHAPVNTVNHTNVNTKQTFAKHTTTNPQAVNPQVAQQNKIHNVHANTSTTNNTTINKTTVVSGQTHGQYTRANNYGGRWTAGDSHQDWNHNDEHDWNGHHYRWYDGGWLIIDGGFWPVPGGAVVYQGGGGSLMASAQQQLANAGYYNGPIDGVAGPGTREAIAHYQSDNNLPATGHLNEPTRQSLGLE